MITLKPGFLIGLKVTRSGGVKYLHENESKRTDGNGGEVAEWKTTRIIADRDEFERAGKVQNIAGNTIRRQCIMTPFGALCTEDNIEALDSAIVEAQGLASEFNGGAVHQRVEVRVLRGRIASDDREAVSAILSEIRDLAGTMAEGIETADVTKIRAAANLAAKMGRMLDSAGQKKVSDAVEAARKVARAIVKRVEERGESAKIVINQMSLTPINNLRAAFLDLDGVGAAADGPELPAVNVGRASQLDLSTDCEVSDAV